MFILIRAAGKLTRREISRDKLREYIENEYLKNTAKIKINGILNLSSAMNKIEQLAVYVLVGFRHIWLEDSVCPIPPSSRPQMPIDPGE